MTCDIETTGTGISTVGQTVVGTNYIGFRCASTFIGQTIDTISLQLYRSGTQSPDFACVLEHYEGTTLQASYFSTTMFNSLPTTDPGSKNVTWTVPITATADTRFVLSYSGLTGSTAYKLMRGTGNALVIFTQSDAPVSWVDTSTLAPNVCIVYGSAPTTSDLLLPPPVAWI